MKSEIDANINALEIHDSVIDNSIVDINSSINDVSTRLASANTSIGKLTNDLRQHVLDCDATHTEFSETWAAALVDIRKDIDDLKTQVSQLQTP